MKTEAIKYPIDVMSCEFGVQNIHVRHARIQLAAIEAVMDTKDDALREIALNMQALGYENGTSLGEARINETFKIAEAALTPSTDKEAS